MARLLQRCRQHARILQCAVAALAHLRRHIVSCRQSNAASYRLCYTVLYRGVSCIFKRAVAALAHLRRHIVACREGSTAL
jgi:hypothetical protein